ncbi:hypothetical protein TWF696_005814 [Orbilia brochopaga]|uniref:Uncharacterized protein n=1 Tax=Orbilia brochopaga TaxID=3140254 RepID=A0AAV9UXD2_9PEZI
MLKFHYNRGYTEAPNPALNHLLDNLAFLLAPSGTEERMALALTGMTGSNVELLAAVSATSPTSGKVEDDGTTTGDSCASAHYISDKACRDFSSIDKHAHFIHSCLRRMGKSDESGEDPRKIYEEFCKRQIEHSFEDIKQRFQRLKSFRRKIKALPLPQEASIIETWDKRSVWDEFSVSPLPDDAANQPSLQSTYQKFIVSLDNTAEDSDLLSWGQMEPIRAESFKAWTELFLWVFDTFESRIQDYETASPDSKEASLNLLLNSLEVIEMLATNSTTFRNWVEGATRLLNNIETQKKKEVAKAAAAIAVEPTDGQPTAKRSRKTLKEFVNNIIGDRFFAILQSRTKNRPRSNAISIPSNTATETATLALVEATSAEELDHLDAEDTESPGCIGKNQAALELNTSSEQASLESPETQDADDEEDDNSPDNDAEISRNFPKIRDIRNEHFRRIWLVSQHLVVAGNVIGSRLAERECKARELTLKYETSKPSVYPCEPLKKCLNRLLTFEGDKKIHRAKIKQSIEDLKVHLEARPKAFESLRELDSDTPSLRVPEHAELLLLSRLSQQPRKDDYPFPYIGTSKPPCFTCEAVLGGSLSFYRYQTGDAHFCASKIPDSFAPGELRSAYKVLDNAAREVVNDFYFENNEKSDEPSPGDFRLITSSPAARW